MTSVKSAPIAISAYEPFASYLKMRCASDNGDIDPSEGYCRATMADLHLGTDGVLHGSLTVILKPYPELFPNRTMPATASEGARVCLAGVTQELDWVMHKNLPGVRIAIDSITVRKCIDGFKTIADLGTVPGTTITIGSPEPKRPSQTLAALAQSFPGTHKLGENWHDFNLDGVHYQYRVRRYFDQTTDDTVRIAIQARDDSQAAEVGPEVHARAEQLVRSEFAALLRELGQSCTLDVQHFKYITGHGPKCGDED